MQHQWEETEMSAWLKREHWQFFQCKRCGLMSDAVNRTYVPNGANLNSIKWEDCDLRIVRQVMES